MDDQKIKKEPGFGNSSDPVTAKVQKKKDPDTIPWKDLKFPKIDPDEFEKRMLQNGIRTYDDARKNRMIIAGILQSLTGMDAATVTAFAKNHMTEVKPHE